MSPYHVLVHCAALIAVLIAAQNGFLSFPKPFQTLGVFDPALNN